VITVSGLAYRVDVVVMRTGAVLEAMLTRLPDMPPAEL
jgi:hypothetical protein